MVRKKFGDLRKQLPQLDDSRMKAVEKPRSSGGWWSWKWLAGRGVLEVSKGVQTIQNH